MESPVGIWDTSDPESQGMRGNAMTQLDLWQDLRGIQ